MDSSDPGGQRLDTIGCWMKMAKQAAAPWASITEYQRLYHTVMSDPLNWFVDGFLSLNSENSARSLKMQNLVCTWAGVIVSCLSPFNMQFWCSSFFTNPQAPWGLCHNFKVYNCALDPACLSSSTCLSAIISSVVKFYNCLTDFWIAHRIQCQESGPGKEHPPAIYRTMILSYCALFSLFLAHSAAQDYTDVQNEAGASGPSSDSVGVSSKGMIVLCTIVGVVVVIGRLFPFSIPTCSLLYMYWYILIVQYPQQLFSSLPKSASGRCERLFVVLRDKSSKQSRRPWLPDSRKSLSSSEEPKRKRTGRRRWTRDSMTWRKDSRLRTRATSLSGLLLANELRSMRRRLEAGDHVSHLMARRSECVGNTPLMQEGTDSCCLWFFIRICYSLRHFICPCSVELEAGGMCALAPIITNPLVDLFSVMVMLSSERCG